MTKKHTAESFTENEDECDVTSHTSQEGSKPIKQFRDADLIDSVVPALLMRAYHLPGYTWRQDLHQYLFNNHPVFGICCHHPMHPVGNSVRIISLIGSVLFGLALTNIIYLTFVISGQDFNKSYASLQADYTTHQEDLDQNVAGVNVTSGNLALWTIGALLHALYDNTIWSLAACSCFMEGADIRERMKKYKSVGVYIALLAVVVTTALATFVVVLRATLESNKDIDASEIRSGGLVDDEVELLAEVDGADDFDFVISYAIELGLTYFIWYPLIGTLLFSGILGCGRLPVLGGRPRDVMVEQREKAALSQDFTELEHDSDYEHERDEEIKSTLASF